MSSRATVSSSSSSVTVEAELCPLDCDDDARSTINRLLIVCVAILVGAAPLSCGGAQDVPRTGDDAVDDATTVSVDEEEGCEGLEACETDCEQGNAVSCEWLGNMYETGEGAPQDYQKAAQLYDLACQQGQEEACAHLAMMYDIGLAVEEDTNRAGELYQKACESGNRWACKRGDQL